MAWSLIACALLSSACACSRILFAFANSCSANSTCRLACCLASSALVLSTIATRSCSLISWFNFSCFIGDSFGLEPSPMESCKHVSWLSSLWTVAVWFERSTSDGGSSWSSKFCDVGGVWSWDGWDGMLVGILKGQVVGLGIMSLDGLVLAAALARDRPALHVSWCSMKLSTLYTSISKDQKSNEQLMIDKIYKKVVF